MRRLALLLATAAVLSTTGCDTGRLAQFGALASTGTAYVTSFHAFTQSAGDAFLAADSASMIAARNVAGPQLVAANSATYAKSLLAEDTQMRRYLATLQTLDRQATLLGQYFAAITAITSGKASAATLTSVDTCVDALNKLNPEVESASLGGRNVKDFLGPTVPLVVTHFEVRALETSLRRSAPTIQRALDLQEAAVKALAAQQNDSLALTLQSDETSRVIAPYTSNAPLPASWASDRAAFLKDSASLDSSHGLTDTIDELRKSFARLVSDPKAGLDQASNTAPPATE